MAVYLPVERAQLLISDLTGGVLSSGFVHSCLGKAAGLVSDAVRLIRTLIAKGYYSQTWQNLAGHQACAAHLTSDFQDCAETYPGAAWPEQAIRSLRGLTRAWYAAREQGLPAIPDEDREPLETEFRRAVAVGLAEERREAEARPRAARILPRPQGRRPPLHHGHDRADH